MKKKLQAPSKGEVDLSMLVSSFLDVQHTRLILENRFRGVGQTRYATYIEGLQAVETEIASSIRTQASHYPICEWLTSQRGIGEVLAGQLIGVIKDIGRFNNVSKLWQYCGYGMVSICEQCGKLWYAPEEKDQRRDHIVARLKEQHDKRVVKDPDEDQGVLVTKANKMLCQCKHPKPVSAIQKRREGILGNWNPKAKMIVHKFGEQFVKQGEYYRDLYDKFRIEESGNLADEIAERAGKVTKKGVTKGTAHVHARAMRRMQKQFLADLWVKWRELEGLPISKPYVIDQLHHTNYEPPPGVGKE